MFKKPLNLHLSQGLTAVAVLMLASSAIADVAECDIGYEFPSQEEAMQWYGRMAEWHILWDPDCIPWLIKGDLGYFYGSDVIEEPAQLLQTFQPLFRPVGSESLLLEHTVPHSNGHTYHRLAQTVHDRPVLNGSVVVETDTETAGIVAIHARFMNGRDLPLEPAIGKEAAASIAADAATMADSANNITGALSSRSQPRLAHIFVGTESHLVWEVILERQRLAGPNYLELLLIDAVEGSVVRHRRSNIVPSGSESPTYCLHGTHRYNWDAVDTATYYELACAWDDEFRLEHASLYIGPETSAVLPIVTDTWCHVRACNDKGCSLWTDAEPVRLYPGCH